MEPIMLSLKKSIFQFTRRNCEARLTGALFLSAFLAAPCLPLIAQAPAPVPAKSGVVPVDRNAAGDAPDNPGPLATDLSSAIKPKAISAAMKKVADWQLAAAEPRFN